MGSFDSTGHCHLISPPSDIELLEFKPISIIKMVQQCATLADLKAQLAEAGEKLVVIDFYATWCGPCKVIAPQIEAMSKEMAEVVFLKVDVDENEDAAQEYNISAMPTFIFIKNQAKVSDMMGANADKLKAMIEQHK